MRSTSLLAIDMKVQEQEDCNGSYEVMVAFITFRWFPSYFEWKIVHCFMKRKRPILGLRSTQTLLRDYSEHI